MQDNYSNNQGKLDENSDENNQYDRSRSKSKDSLESYNHNSQRSQSRNQSCSRSNSSYNEDNMEHDQDHDMEINNAASHSEGNNQISDDRKKIFDYDLFFENEQKDIILQDEKQFVDAVQQASKISEIKIDKSFSIPDLNGVLVRFIDKEQQPKYEALQQAFKFVYDRMSEDKDKGFTAICLVPNGMVSLVIGIKGKQINQIMNESNTKVVANQPINKMTSRTIRIDGEYKKVAVAIKLIYQIIEERSPKVSQIEKEPQPVNYQEQESKARYVINNKVKKYLEQKKDFIRNLEKDFKVSFKFYEDRKQRQLKKTDIICSIKGKLQDIFPSSMKFFEKVDQFYNQNPNDLQDYYLRLLIPNRYVTKLIGAGGCMIKDIAAKSKGAQIKIMSDKQKDRDQRECLISIAGALACKVDACLLILQQLEIFKNGGPILISGKNINDNLVNQFKNSVQDQESSIKNTENFIRGGSSSNNNNNNGNNNNMNNSGMNNNNMNNNKRDDYGNQGNNNNMGMNYNNQNNNKMNNQYNNNNQMNHPYNQGNQNKYNNQRDNQRDMNMNQRDNMRGDMRDNMRDSRDNQRDNRDNQRDNMRDNQRDNMRDQRMLSPSSRMRKDSSDYRKMKSKSRSRSRSQNKDKNRQRKREKEADRYSPDPRYEKDQKKKISVDEYEGKIRLLVPIKVANKLEKQFIQSFKDISRCQKICFEDEKDFQDSQYRRLLMKGTTDQIKQAFNLIQREIFLSELDF
ncbi:KH domain protein (macronuclear) [Tetrahymena thermophila SB210]|uniref:KH domain protein n=1 Tax=Tetrahymena thermophila (strain SB210) TaxID=312017 RepID=Q23DM7_TETTS|nr:KH domain protein [Tetrahymena thermophila SB210]EAR94501.3 KH domain protein [Tetrahymena thermophila SB210]|eukprot:XP_001014659.3 KH domain protein [Tetrahymena thermophila SB210]